MIVGTDTGPHLLSADSRRISIRAGTAVADIALPDDMPVSEMIPPVSDIFAEAGAPLSQHPYRLHRPGQPALDQSMSLSQLDIADGTLLILTPANTAPPAGPVLHAADATALVACADAHAWTPAQSRLAALLIAITLAATTGLLTVPGEVGTPNLLLAAAAATAAASFGCRVADPGRTVLMAVTTTGALATLATFTAALFEFRAPVTGAVLAVLSVGVLSLSGRLALLISGLSGYITPELNLDADGPDQTVWHRSSRAQQILTALLVGASVATALGGTTVALGADRRVPDFLVTASLAVLLTVRSRMHHQPARRCALLGAGLVCTTALFIGMALTDPGLLPWLWGAAAVLAAAALWLGFVSFHATGAPPIRRGLDLLDCVLLAAVLPLACWSSGLYDVVRGLGL